MKMFNTSQTIDKSLQIILIGQINLIPFFRNYLMSMDRRTMSRYGKRRKREIFAFRKNSVAVFLQTLKMPARKSWCPTSDPCKYCLNFAGKKTLRRACQMRPPEILAQKIAKRKKEMEEEEARRKLRKEARLREEEESLTLEQQRDNPEPEPELQLEHTKELDQPEQKEEKQSNQDTPETIVLPFSPNAFKDECFLKLHSGFLAKKTMLQIASILNKRLQGGVRKQGEIVVAQVEREIFDKIIENQPVQPKKKTTTYRIKRDYKKIALPREFYYFSNNMPVLNVPNWWEKYHPIEFEREAENEEVIEQNLLQDDETTSSPDVSEEDKFPNQLRSRYYDITFVYTPDNGLVKVKWKQATEKLFKNGWCLTV